MLDILNIRDFKDSFTLWTEVFMLQC